MREGEGGNRGTCVFRKYGKKIREKKVKTKVSEEMKQQDFFLANTVTTQQHNSCVCVCVFCYSYWMPSPTPAASWYDGRAPIPWPLLLGGAYTPWGPAEYHQLFDWPTYCSSA